MIPELREGVLKVEGAAVKEEEDGVDVEEKSESENTTDTGYQSEDNRDNDKESETNDKEQEVKKYRVSVLSQIQFIFGHLAQSQLQFHVPQGFWKTFKLVNHSFLLYLFIYLHLFIFFYLFTSNLANCTNKIRSVISVFVCVCFFLFFLSMCCFGLVREETE